MKDHLRRHRKKYTLTAAIAVVPVMLQMFGVLAPLLCMATPNEERCLEAGRRAEDIVLQLDDADAGVP